MIAPNKIYLQIEGDNLGDWEGVTWCQDKINDSDIEYVNVNELLALAEEHYWDTSLAKEKESIMHHLKYVLSLCK